MLQIASGMYYDDPDDVYETIHRRTLYSNAVRGRADDVELPFGVLRFTSGAEEIQPLTIEATDRLEKKNPDGTPSPFIATGGDDLIADAADVVAFGLDVIVLLDPAQAERVVAGWSPRGVRRPKLLRRVLQPMRFISDEELDELRALAEDLLALDRPHFEAVLRAIRRVSDAVVLTSTDVALAYTLFVAALESLSKDAPIAPSSWDQYDGAKRKIIDEACTGVAPGDAARIRAAVLQIDHLSIRRKFQAFVLDHVAGSFFREEAREAKLPIRAVDLPRALDFAYRVRSMTMHELRDLAPELWMLADDEDTIWHDGQTVLTLEGLHRLCQHVIREYIKRATRGIDLTFKANYRAALPGRVQARWAPQYWLGTHDNFAAADGPAVFSGLVNMVIAARRGERDSIVDMSTPLQRIEVLLRAEAKADARVPLIATYVLWHEVVPEEFRRPDPGRVIDPHVALLDEPSMYAYVNGLLLGRELPWDYAQLERLADGREKALRQGSRRAVELPRRVDAALQLDLAGRAHARGADEEAKQRMEKAIQLLPGDATLIEMEARAALGHFSTVGLGDFVVDRPSEASGGEGTNYEG